jgi:deoxyribodipyrimidine photo-lyase
MKVNIFWFRRDLRLEDNTALEHALAEGNPVLPVFIFDTNIMEDLNRDDPRITFIYDTLSKINQSLRKEGSSILILNGNPISVWKKLIVSYDINAVYINKDYEPYAISSDKEIENILREKGISLFQYKDQVIFEEKEVIKPDNSPYTIFTPYKNKWLHKFTALQSASQKNPKPNYFESAHPFQSLKDLGFTESQVKVSMYDLSAISEYHKFRDFPAEDKTTHLGPHLRFGTVSIRKIVRLASEENAVFLSELIWREFFMQILFNFPHVVTSNFRSKFNNIPWRNDEKEFDLWCKGETGYPLVDAGMRQLNETGYMHNRVRMITAGFLCKHLLTDWRWGEAYFAQKLLDYELSSNNGNWQWAAGTGCDAAQYFRVFNPDSQQQKFDRNKIYIRQWVKDLEDKRYPQPIVDHVFARERVISAYKSGFNF